MATISQKLQRPRQPTRNQPTSYHNQKPTKGHIVHPFLNVITPSNSKHQFQIPTSPTQQNNTKIFSSISKEHSTIITPRNPTPQIQRSFGGLPHSQNNQRISFSRDPNTEIVQNKPVSNVSGLPIHQRLSRNMGGSIPIVQQRQIPIANPKLSRQIQRTQTSPQNIGHDNPVAYYMQKIRESEQLLSQIQGLIHHRQKSGTNVQQVDQIRYQEPPKQLIESQQFQYYQPSQTIQTPQKQDYQQNEGGFNEAQYQKEIQQHNLMSHSQPQQYYPEAHQIVFSTKSNQFRGPQFAHHSELQQIEEVVETGQQVYHLDELKQIVFGDQPYQQVQQETDQMVVIPKQYSSEYPNQYSNHYSNQYTNRFQNHYQNQNSQAKYNINVQEIEDHLRIPRQLYDDSPQHLQTQQSQVQRQQILKTINSELQSDKKEPQSKRQSHNVTSKNPNFMMFLDGAELLSYYDLHQRLLKDKDELAVLYQQSFGLGPID